MRRHDDPRLDDLVAESVKDRRDYLTQLDAAIGDGDHGVNMDRGFDAVGKALAAQDGSLPPGQAPDRGRQDARVDGRRRERSALGDGVPPGRAARSATARSSTAQDLVAALRAALDGVVELGAAQPGDKTMVDALGPAIDALSAALDAGEPLDEALAAATEAAEERREGNGAAPGP